MNYFKKIAIAIAFVAGTISLTGCFSSGYVTSAPVQYYNPDWAPPYYTGVRYYYLPDYEMYYDLSNRNFVYMDNGNWMFSPMLPSIYGSINLGNAFVVSLNSTVFNPWMHHDIYERHYPRYYYREVYNNYDHGYARGYNENIRKPYYTNQDRRPEGYNNRNENIGRRDQQVFRTNRQQNQGNAPQGQWNRQQPQNNGQQPQNQGNNDQRRQWNRQQPQNNGQQPQNNRQQPQGNQQQPQPGNRQQPQGNTRPQPQENRYKNMGQPVQVKPEMRERNAVKRTDRNRG